MKTILFVFTLIFVTNAYNTLHAQYTWKKVPGTALDIASGPNGAIYAVGTSKNVLKWNAQRNNWDLLAGLENVKELVAMKHGMLLALTHDGKLFYYHPGAKAWRSDWFISSPGLPNFIHSIHHSPDPNYGVSTLAESVKVVSNNRVYQYRNNRWNYWDYSLRYVNKVVEPKQGNVYYINTDKRIVNKPSYGKWIVPGAAQDITAGQDGSVWIVDLDNRIKKLASGRTWYHEPSLDLVEARRYAIRDIAVDADGFPWVISKSNQIYKRVKGTAPNLDVITPPTKSYTLDVKRLCIQNHDEGWGKEEIAAWFSVFKGRKGRPLEKVGSTYVFINSDEGKFKNVRRTQGRDLYVSGRKVSGVKLDNFEIHRSEGFNPNS